MFNYSLKKWRRKMPRLKCNFSVLFCSLLPSLKNLFFSFHWIFHDYCYDQIKFFSRILSLAKKRDGNPIMERNKILQMFRHNFNAKMKEEKKLFRSLNQLSFVMNGLKQKNPERNRPKQNKCLDVKVNKLTSDNEARRRREKKEYASALPMCFFSSWLIVLVYGA